MPRTISIKRAYDPPATSDGKRILVDRLWPRGLSRADAHVDLWLKDIAPSSELRREFKHDPERWPAFVTGYREELANNPEPVEQVLAVARNEPVTLLFSAHDREHNNAVVLADLLTERLRDTE